MRGIDRCGSLASACLLALALLAASSVAAGAATLVLKTDTGDHSFDIEVVTTDRDRALGLMFRRSLPENAGMLFLYDPPATAAMWMKNTLIPLDMVFISPDGRVHRIESGTEPFSTSLIPSEGTVAAVLELNAGQADKIGLKRGDKVVYPGLVNGKGR